MEQKNLILSKHQWIEPYGALNMLPSTTAVVNSDFAYFNIDIWLLQTSFYMALIFGTVFTVIFPLYKNFDKL